MYIHMYIRSYNAIINIDWIIEHIRIIEHILVKIECFNKRIM